MAFIIAHAGIIASLEDNAGATLTFTRYRQRCQNEQTSIVSIDVCLFFYDNPMVPLEPFKVESLNRV